MDASKTAMAALLVALCLDTGCALVLRKSSDEIRRQQNGSEAFAEGDDSRKQTKQPWRAIVHTASYDAADGLVDGALDTLEDPKRKQQLDALGDDLTARVGDMTEQAGVGLMKGVNTTLPETRAVLVKMMQELRDELGLDPEKAARSAMRGVFDETQVGIRKVRPQLHAMFEDDVVGVLKDAFGEAFGPGLKDRVRDDIKPAIDELGVPELAEEVGRKTALGFSAGMAEALRDDGDLGTLIDGRVDRAKQTAGEAKDAVDEWLARGLLLAFVVAVIVLVLVVFRWVREHNERMEAERARLAAAEEGERRERMLRLVASAIHRAGQRDDLIAFRQEIKTLAHDDQWRKPAAALSHFLTLEGLKLERPRGTPTNEG